MILFISFIVVEIYDTPLLTDISKRNRNMHHQKNIQRPYGIGGSDIAALLGLSPYKTPLELWAEKVGHPGIKESQGMHFRFGQHVEPFIAKEYER